MARRGKFKRSVFHPSYENKLTCNAGQLIPILVKDVLPGDTWSVNTNLVMRLAPMLAPIMQQLDVYVHFWYVPLRIIWDDWLEFFTNPDSKIEPPHFVQTSLDGSIDSSVQNQGKIVKGSLFDYMGIPIIKNNRSSSATDPTLFFKFSALPFRAYNLIWNNWYRHQYLQDEVPLVTTSGRDTETLVNILSKNWGSDYFTNCLPSRQLGNPASVPVDISGNFSFTGLNKNGSVGVDGVLTMTDDQNNIDALAVDNSKDVQFSQGINSSSYLFVNRLGGLTLDEANSKVDSSFTISDFRQAYSLQRFQEKLEHHGVRPVEFLESIWHVRDADSRLQLPEYLGGGKSPILITPVTQTSAGTSTSPQGNMSGHGFTAQKSNDFLAFCPEYGYILGLMFIMPKTGYYQGLQKHMSRFDFFDYAVPEFANLSDQPVYEREIYATGYTKLAGSNTKNVLDEDVFGYQGRYDEYRFFPDELHGDFIDNMDYWHMARKFDSAPHLNSEFINCNPTTRVFAVTDKSVHHYWVDIYHEITVKRRLPKYAVPSL